MIRSINYDFNDLIDDCADIIAYPTNGNFLSLRRDLNKFFKDSNCTNILYTNNDSLFFGMCVYPIVNKEN
jgi:hypothetical protein